MIWLFVIDFLCSVQMQNSCHFTWKINKLRMLHVFAGHRICLARSPLTQASATIENGSSASLCSSKLITIEPKMTTNATMFNLKRRESLTLLLGDLGRDEKLIWNFWCQKMIKWAIIVLLLLLFLSNYQWIIVLIMGKFQCFEFGDSWS